MVKLGKVMRFINTFRDSLRHCSRKGVRKCKVMRAIHRSSPMSILACHDDGNYFELNFSYDDEVHDREFYSSIADVVIGHVQYT